MLKILVTGANGVVGRHVCRLLKNNYPHIHVTPFTGDLCILDNVHKNFNNQNYDYIIHLASMVAVAEVDKNPAKAYSVNVGGTTNLLRVAIDNATENQYSLPFFFLASSSHIYAPRDFDISETDKAGSHSLYGRTKYMAEQVTHDICTQTNMPLLIGRIFSFYDDAQKPPFLYPSIKERLASEDLSKPFELYGAESLRDISKACDIADMIIRLILKNIHGIMNIASGNAIKISDFVQSLSYKKLNIISKGTVNRLTADISLLKQVLNDTKI